MEATLQEQLEAPLSESPETTPSTQEAPPEQEVLQPSTELQEFLQSQGLAEESKPDGTPSDGEDGVDEDEQWVASLPENQQAKARELLETKRETRRQEDEAKETARLRGLETQRNRYANTQAALDAYFQPVISGQREFSSEDLQRLKATFNNYNNDILALVREEPQALQERARQSFLGSLTKAAVSVLPASQKEAIEKGDFKSPDDFLKKVVAAARDGWDSPATTKAKIADALLKYENELIKKNRLSGPAGKAPGAQNTSRPSGQRKAEEVIDDPTATFEEKNEAFKSLYGIEFPR